MLTAHLKSRNPGALPVRPYTYRVFAAESSRSSNIPTFLAAAVSRVCVRARCVLSLSRARVCVWCRLTLCHCSGHSALCAHALLKCQQLSRLVSGGSGGVLLHSSTECVCTLCVCRTHSHNKNSHRRVSVQERHVFFNFLAHIFHCVLSHTRHDTGARAATGRRLRGPGARGGARA